MQQTISIVITGKVQGVFFRQSSREKAIKTGVCGEVKNMADGSVVITATGTREQLEELIQWCRLGPPKAVVKNVEVKELELQLFDHFSIHRF